MLVDDETPLHLAVLDDDQLKAKELSQDPALLQAQNRLGFTALEIAQLLGKRKYVQILHPQLPQTFKVLPKEQISPLELSEKEFEEFFNIRYLSHLRFATYQELKDVIHNCPWILKSSSLGQENRELGKKYREEILAGYTVEPTIQWVDDVFGYGAFAGQDLAPGTFVGEYTGLVRRLYRLHPDHNGYCFHYPTRFFSWKYYMVDALKEGNLLRFVNHSDEPTLEPLCLVDRGLLHLAFRTKGLIKRGAQLTFDYGTDYWKRREKFALDAG